MNKLSLRSKYIRPAVVRPQLRHVPDEMQFSLPVSSDRNAALSMLAGLIAQAMDQEDEKSARALVECYTKIIRKAPAAHREQKVALPPRPYMNATGRADLMRGSLPSIG